MTLPTGLRLAWEKKTQKKKNVGMGGEGSGGHMRKEQELKIVPWNPLHYGHPNSYSNKKRAWGGGTVKKKNQVRFPSHDGEQKTKACLLWGTGVFTRGRNNSEAPFKEVGAGVAKKKQIIKLRSKTEQRLYDGKTWNPLSGTAGEVSKGKNAVRFLTIREPRRP